MKNLKIIVIALVVAALAVPMAVSAEESFSRERQREIVEHYLYVTGQLDPRSQAQAEIDRTYSEVPLKCGTPAVLQFMQNRDKIDKDIILSLGVTDIPRPSLDLSYGSPDGHFLIHYTVTGEDSVYRSSDDSDGDGVPDYIESVAVIADSVYGNIIGILGFPPPVNDTTCDAVSTNPDGRFDIYISALSSSVFGLTYADTACVAAGGNLMMVPAFMELDNDYAHIPQYASRPLDAVRVTMAHEFFHAVQFALDWTEWQNLTWLEMSSTWMEEHLYDHINDYYAYLPFYFEQPRASLQQFFTGADFHPYGSVVFPIFLSEKYGPGVIRAIWQECADLGFSGGHFLIATDNVVRALSLNSDSLPSVFAEFALWNYFTGERASLAPSGVGYTERQSYPAVPLDSMLSHNVYPTIVRLDTNKFNPQHMAATYVRFDETDILQEDRFWTCEPYNRPSAICGDSSRHEEVLDTTLITPDLWDSVFTIFGAYQSLHKENDVVSYPWGLSVIYQLKDFPDSIIYESTMLPSAMCAPVVPRTSCLTGFLLESDRVNKYEHITVVLSPGSPDSSFYRGIDGRPTSLRFGYDIPERLTVDSTKTNLAAAILTPYPNPVILAEMSGETITFRFQAPTDSMSRSWPVDPHLVIDLFTITGDRIQTLAGDPIYDYFGNYELEWDMTNAFGKEVASGVYLCYARLYDAEGGELLAEDHSKVAIIR